MPAHFSSAGCPAAGGNGAFGAVRHNSRMGAGVGPLPLRANNCLSGRRRGRQLVQRCGRKTAARLLRRLLLATARLALRANTCRTIRGQAIAANPHGQQACAQARWMPALAALAALAALRCAALRFASPDSLLLPPTSDIPVEPVARLVYNGIRKEPTQHLLANGD
jgi:hypothetical protein